MYCNVIDVIHWSAQRVWRTSPVEPAAMPAITVHILGAHTATSYLWMNLTAEGRGRESDFEHYWDPYWIKNIFRVRERELTLLICEGKDIYFFTSWH